MVNNSRALRDIDTIVLLPAGIKQTPSGAWASTDLSKEDDLLGAPGGKLRVLAAVILAQKLPETMIVTGGGIGFDVGSKTSTNQPKLAEIVREELLEAGISPARIVLEWTSNSTFQELQELGKIITQIRSKRIAVITNRWHLARLQAILDARFEQLNALADINLIAAENILIEHDPTRWRPFIAKAYQSNFMKKRMEKEKLGIEHIRLGIYKFR